MERAARRLASFSLLAFVVVILTGSLRSMGPVKEWLESPELHHATALFHSHFDQLCWLGTAASAAVMWILRDSYRGGALAPSLFSWAYPLGTLLFSFSFLVKGFGQSAGSPLLTKPLFAILASVGGFGMLLAAGAGAAIAWGLGARKP